MHPTCPVVLTRPWDGQKQKIVTLSAALLPAPSSVCSIFTQTPCWRLRSLRLRLRIPEYSRPGFQFPVACTLTPKHQSVAA
jgi:hypothetical protein